MWCYDALGRRIEYGDCTRNVTARYYYDGQNVIAEYDQNDGVQRSYVHGMQYVDERAVLRDHSNPAEKPTGKKFQDRYYLLAELYTVTGLADCRGWLEEAYVHDTYGHVTMDAWPFGDVNRDGSTTNSDYTVIQQMQGQAHPWGDADLNGTVNTADYSAIASHVGETTQQVTHSAVENPYHFTGRTTDTLHASALLVSEDPDFKRIQDNRNRMYDPKHGRWLQRDPAGHVDGMNLCQYVGSQPARRADPIGAFGNDLHKGWTIAWARDEGMRVVASQAVGTADAATDRMVPTRLETPFGAVGAAEHNSQGLVYGEDQSYHFNSNKTGPDSRRVHQSMALHRALGACLRGDNPGEAAAWLGHGLHALQDWWAHGDWAKGRFDLVHHGFDLPYDDWHYDATGTVYTVHKNTFVANVTLNPDYGPPSLGGQPTTPDYTVAWTSHGPEESSAFDAPNGKRPVQALANGRPAQLFGFTGEEGYDYEEMKHTFKGEWWEARWPFWAWGVRAGPQTWTRGSQRFDGARRESKAYIADFLGRVCSQCNNGACPKCQCYFLNFNPLEGGKAKWCWR